jgi:phage anti-repressor protein
MADLVPFALRRIGHDEVNTVKDEDLYDCLELTTDKATWIIRAIKRARLVKDLDYVVFHKMVENPKGGRPANEYHLTFEAGAQVAMMSSATKGQEVRLWFIHKAKELEALKRSTGTTQVKNPANQMLIEAIVRLDAVEQQAQQAQHEAARAQAQAEHAEAKAEQAEANAQRAYDARDFYTVAEYMKFEHLEHKIPTREYQAISAHLQSYCSDKGIPFRRIHVGGKPWEHEYGYHRSVYTEALSGWLRRRYAQDTLRVIHPTQEGPA